MAGEWRGFQTEEIVVDGVKGYVVVPRDPLPGKPWLWRARFPEYHPEAAVALAREGVYLAYYDLPNIFGSPAAVRGFDHFYGAVRKKFGLSKRVVMEAVSRGGLFAYNWAATHPEQVAAVYGESPVCDMKSWPGGKGKGVGSEKDWAEALKAYGFTEAQMMAFRGNPVDHAAKLAKFRIPILHVISEEDRVVPWDENSAVFAERYRAAGGSVEVYHNLSGPTEDRGHHFPLDDVNREVDFVLKHVPAR